MTPTPAMIANASGHHRAHRLQAGTATPSANFAPQVFAQRR